jgi:tetratricopeptide (TPR) repeat protein
MSFLLNCLPSADHCGKNSLRYLVLLRMAKRRMIEALMVVVSLLFASSCTVPRLGIGGAYQGGREEVTKPRGGNIDLAIRDLETVVVKDPTYRDSLTLLGRAYYKKGRYADSNLILQRAVALHKDDEIAWIVLGLTQLRLGENQRGLESVKGGLTLLGKAMGGGQYRDYTGWDPSGVVRASFNRSAFLAGKGLDEKDSLISTIENLLNRIDDEDWRQARDATPTPR